jgi:DNA-binding GntR family transcriptional regulator
MRHSLWMDVPEVNSQLTVVSIVDAIAENLRTQLFNGEILGDATFTEAKVATTYDVARPTAKAAIERLVSEGLLIRDAHKTARVPSMDAEDIRDLYFSRKCVEVEVVRALARRHAKLAHAESANRTISGFHGQSDLGAIAPVVDFHLSLVHALGSERMQRIFTGLMGEMRLCMAQMQRRRLLHLSLIAEEHEAILAAVAKGAPNAAAQAMSVHLDNARDRLLPALEAEANPRGSVRT